MEITKFKVRNNEFDLGAYSGKKYINSVLFASLSGSDAYGWSKEDSDIDIRLVWIPNLSQALSVRYRGNNKESKIELENGIIVDLTKLPLYRFLGLLIKGNGNSLENLFQDKLISKDKLIKELQQLTLENLHIKFLKHFIGYYDSLKKDMNIPSRLEKYGIQKLLLNSYRVLRAGIILAEHREVVYNLDVQEEYLPAPFWNKIREDYLNSKESYYLFTKHAKAKLEFLEKDLANLIKSSKWYKEFPTIVFDGWLKDYYVGNIKDE